VRRGARPRARSRRPRRPLPLGNSTRRARPLRELRDALDRRSGLFRVERALHTLHPGPNPQALLSMSGDEGGDEGKDATMKYLGLLALTVGGLGCNEIEPGSCYPNSAGGAGGADSLPIAGVGATTTGDYDEPPWGPRDDGPRGEGSKDEPPPYRPQDASSPPPGCNGGGDPEFGKPASQYIDCRKRGLSPLACAEVCAAAGAPCGPGASHPYKKEQGGGALTWCKNGEPTVTCTYTFPNGDGCALTLTPVGPYWICMYAGGG
jgi:hypothetical protein